MKTLFACMMFLTLTPVFADAAGVFQIPQAPSATTRFFDTLKTRGLNLDDVTLTELKEGLDIYGSDFDFKDFAERHGLTQDFLTLAEKFYRPQGVYRGPTFTLQPADDKGGVLRNGE